MNDQIALFGPIARNVLTESGAIDLSAIPKNQIIQESFYKMRDVLSLYEKAICSVSGGYDSDIMVDMIHQLNATGKVTFVFSDTGLEYAATKLHLDDLEHRYGISIKRIRAKKTIPVACRENGVPFWSKHVSNMIGRLQAHDFTWEDKPFEELNKQFPNCRSALRWWCNDFGDQKNSRFDIEYIQGLKEFMVANPPSFKISESCCEYAKKKPMKDCLKENGASLRMIGIRKKEGGIRAARYTTCFDSRIGDADNYRPLFWWSDEDKEEYRKWFSIIRSDCYEVWGMKRTGCSGCPFGKKFQEELELAKNYEPNHYKAMLSIFGESYEYTRKFLKFRKQLKEKDADQINIFEEVT